MNEIAKTQPAELAKTNADPQPAISKTTIEGDAARKYDPDPAPPAVPPDLPETLSLWYSDLSERTRETYHECLQDYASFRATTITEALKELCASDKFSGLALVGKYKAGMMGRCSPRTINLRLGALRSFASAAEFYGLMSWTLKIKGLKASKPDRRGPGPEGVAQILEQAEKHSNVAKAARDQAIISLLFLMALRSREVYDSNLEHIDPDARLLLVLRKGKKTREALPIPDPTMELIAHWIEFRGTNPGPLFTSFDRSKKGKRNGRISYSGIRAFLKKLGDNAQLKVRVRPHGLRHALATFGLNEFNGDGRKVARVTGHDDPSTLHKFYDDDLGEVRAVSDELARAWKRFLDKRASEKLVAPNAG